MIVMPANSTGWFWHCLARETGRIGHLYSPGAQRGPYPWFPFALDNGAFQCWDMGVNKFDHEKWASIESEWLQLVRWAAPTGLARWAIVPDVPGDAEGTLEKWSKWRQFVFDAGIEPALAVQDGMKPDQVLTLADAPNVVCVGGTTDWKWQTLEAWKGAFKRVHVLRCNSPEKLYYLESLGVESCDGTGWNRGDRKQTSGLEVWARSQATPRTGYLLSDHVCRKPKNGQLELFAIGR
jgi:hypothetical protein